MKLPPLHPIRMVLVCCAVCLSAASTAQPSHGSPPSDWTLEVRIECLGGFRSSWEARASSSGFQGRTEAAMDLGWAPSSAFAFELSGLILGDFRPDVRFGHGEGELEAELTLLPEWTAAISLYSAWAEGSKEFEDSRLLRGLWRTDVDLHSRFSLDLSAYVEEESLFRLPRTDRNARISAGATLLASRTPLLMFSLEGGLEYIHSSGTGKSGTAPDLLLLCLLEPGEGFSFLLAAQVRHEEQFDKTRFDSAWIALEGRLSVNRRTALKILFEYYTANGNESGDDDRFFSILAGLELTF